MMTETRASVMSPGTQLGPGTGSSARGSASRSERRPGIRSRRRMRTLFRARVPGRAPAQTSTIASTRQEGFLSVRSLRRLAVVAAVLALPLSASTGSALAQSPGDPTLTLGVGDDVAGGE